MRLAIEGREKAATVCNKIFTRKPYRLAGSLYRHLRLCLALAGPVAVFAATGEAPAHEAVDGRALPALAGQQGAVQSDDISRWTLSLEALAFKRSNTVSQTLVSRLPGDTTPFWKTKAQAGDEAFNSRQFDQGYAAGSRITLNYHADARHQFELSYLSVLNLNAQKAIGPENPGNWYVMDAPGFWQTQDFYYQGMTWATTTNLYTLEANLKSALGENLKVLAGLRWLRLKDKLTGSLTQGDRNEPVWKTGGCASDQSRDAIFESVAGMTLPGTAQACAAGGAIDGYPPFWSTSTTNDLFGLQAGADGVFLSSGGFSLGGVAKAGIYDNRARQSAAVSIEKQMYYASTQRHRLAFVGQAALQARYALSRNLAAKAGYELLWLDRVALAPGQISQTYAGANPTSETATGVNAGSSLLMQGFTLGFELVF